MLPFCLMTSYNFDDFLAQTLPSFRHQYDQVFLLVDPKDQATQELGHSHGATVLLTDAFFLNGDPLNKGRALNYGMSVIQNTGYQGWITLLDSDIYFPPDFKWPSELDPTCLYYTLRADVRSQKELDQFRKNPDLFRNLPSNPKENPGTGFFQHFHISQYKTPFCESSRDASLVDTVFRSRFLGRLRPLGFTVLHLGRTRCHWRGRRGSRWR